MNAIECADPDCDESVFGFKAARESRNGRWRCPEHRRT